MAPEAPTSHHNQQQDRQQPHFKNPSSGGERRMKFGEKGKRREKETTNVCTCLKWSSVQEIVKARTVHIVQVMSEDDENVYGQLVIDEKHSQESQESSEEELPDLEESSEEGPPAIEDETSLPNNEVTEEEPSSEEGPPAIGNETSLPNNEVRINSTMLVSIASASDSDISGDKLKCSAKQSPVTQQEYSEEDPLKIHISAGKPEEPDPEGSLSDKEEMMVIRDSKADSRGNVRRRKRITSSADDDELATDNMEVSTTHSDNAKSPREELEVIQITRKKKKKIVSFREKITLSKDAKKLQLVLEENSRLKEKVINLKMENREMKKQLKNVVKKKKVVRKTTPAVLETVEELEEKLEEMKKNKIGFYAKKGSFPIKESLKRSIKAKYPDEEQAIYKLLDELYSFEYMEIHKKTEKDATKGTSLKIAMDPNELKEIRDTMMNLYPTMKCGKGKLSTIVEKNITNKMNKTLKNPDTIKWLQDYNNLVKDLEKAIDAQGILEPNITISLTR
ncbi:hypothetical protein DAPPUDRAFT_257503 [Daphnia pulex]|uniref:BEN domain-containing protein n=1 Tax=Daphnia pulex TaxID=6669 RepID=E9HDP8_DAPPU|nr:hypothetical protein DAPPUDRAFT_257503 [Daphnia pulex]|eukprot:EFX70064.1 hypothetical protein DAPPUDRAFT_257503 [Daphnia pulex]